MMARIEQTWNCTADCQSVLVGSSSLALWNVAEQKRIAKFMGHSVSTTPQIFAFSV